MRETDFSPRANAKLTTAILDRLIYHCEIISMTRNCYRLEHHPPITGKLRMTVILCCEFWLILLDCLQENTRLPSTTKNTHGFMSVGILLVWNQDVSVLTVYNLIRKPSAKFFCNVWIFLICVHNIRNLMRINIIIGFQSVQRVFIHTGKPG